MSDTPLATVGQLAAYMKETIAADDASALIYLQIASGLVRDYLQRELTAATADVVVLDPLDGAYIFLPELPISAVSLVEVFDHSTQTWSTAAAGTFTVSARLGIIAGRPGVGVCWPSDPGSWRVTYDHGFDDIPDGIVGVVLGVAARGYATDPGVESERIGGYNVKYSTDSDFSAIEQKALNRYLLPRVA